ncbi:amidohydrolase family protein [Zhouia spongiae]|uniref:Amidohydrolase family protein n=1 Tax=Zhouia spongiae TaxID=2202721 RepID=A0ABY3YMD4_9FLAO|nr:amidohydrolase family protein [Zhouia spongiae]UNY98762.1 amidohydrolase family protein [Zhouia spongiae]
MNKLQYYVMCLVFVMILHTNIRAQQQSDPILLRNVFIVDVTSVSSPKKGAILVEGTEISEVFYDKDSIAGFKGTVFDLSGKYVIPGLIDAHVHLATVPKPDLSENRKETEKVLHKMLYAGITTVRDMAGNAVLLGYYERASALQQIPAPEIYYAAQFAGPGYFDMINTHSDDQRQGYSPWSRIITDTTDIRQVVAEAKGAGVTGIKIYNDLSAGLVKKITAEAHRQHLQAWSHAAVFPAMPADVAVAGVNSMSHAFDMAHEVNPDMSAKMEPIDERRLDKVFGMMKANNIILDPTNLLAENNGLENSVRITKRAKEKGVEIVAGTDWPYTMDNSIPLVEELQLLVNKCGFTPFEALKSATNTGAKAIGLNDRGIIQKGKRADLVILSGNPLEDLNRLLNPELIIKGGKIYKP